MVLRISCPCKGCGDGRMEIVGGGWDMFSHNDDVWLLTMQLIHPSAWDRAVPLFNIPAILNVHSSD